MSQSIAEIVRLTGNPAVCSTDWLGHWFSTEESLEHLPVIMASNCFPFACIALDAHKKSQRQRPLCFPLSVLDRVALSRPLFRLAELQMALARHAGVGIFPIWLRWGHWRLCKWLAYFYRQFLFLLTASMPLVVIAYPSGSGCPS